MAEEIKTAEAVIATKTEVVDKAAPKAVVEKPIDMSEVRMNTLAGAIKFVASRIPGCLEDLASIYPKL